MSLFARLRSFDVYRDVPKELSEPTSTGGLISLSAILILSYLVLTELSSHLSGVTTHQLLIEQPHPPPPSSSPHQPPSHDADLSSAYVHSIDHSLSVTVHLNLTFYHVPCVALGIEVQDLFGALPWGSDKGLVRLATDAHGRVKGGRAFQGISNDMAELQRHVGEGCSVYGQMVIESVPGNFHFLPGLSYQHLALFYPDHFINTSHTVHYLYFGDLTRKQLKAERIPIVMDSIHDHTRLVLEDESAEAHSSHIAAAPQTAGVGPGTPPRFHFSKSFEYYLRIVSTTYSSSPSHSVQTYQYTSHANDVVIPRALPAVYFRYDFSPVTIKVAKVHAPLAHFLVELCAIVGGVFTVLRVIHSMARSMEARPQHKGMGGATEMVAAAPTRYGALTVQPSEPEMANGYGGGLSGTRGMTPVMSPEIRDYVTGAPLQRQGSAPALSGDRQVSNGAYDNARANGSGVYTPVHRQQVHGAPAKPYDGHDD